MRFVDYRLFLELHDAHRVAGHPVVRDEDLADPEVAAARDAVDGEMSIGGVRAALCGDRVTAPKSFTRLRIVEDGVGAVDGVLDLALSVFGCLPVSFE